MSATSAALLLCAAPAAAQERSLYLGLASGLVQRGVARAPDAATLLAGLDVYPADGWTVGVSGAMLRAARRPGQTLQLVGQVAYDGALQADWRWQFGLRHYEYPLDWQPARLRYDALHATLAYGDLASLSVTGSPNARATYAYPYQTEAGQGGRGTLAYDLALRWPVVPRLFADAGLGYQDLRRLMGGGYTYGSLGASLLWREAQISITYIATDSRAKWLFGRYADNRWAATLIWQL